MKTKLFIISLFILKVGIISPQSFQIEKIDVYNGLSDDYVLSVTQDRAGFIWFATEWGLNRFDGKKIKIFKNDFTNNSIIANDLNKILADKTDNIIWIATQRNGLSAFHCDSQTFVNYPYNTKEPNSTNANGITDLSMASDGNIWIATYGNGVKKLDKKENKIIHYDQLQIKEIKNAKIWSVVEDGNANLYIGHAFDGLSILSLKNNTLKHFKPGFNGLGESVRQIYIDSKKNIWLATNKGLALYRPTKDTFTVFKHNKNSPNSLISDEVVCIREIDKDKLWIGTEKNGISILSISETVLSSTDDIRFLNISSNELPSGLSNSSIRDIFRDSYENLWIATYGGGVNFISHQSHFFNTLTYNPIIGVQNSLSAKTVKCIVSENENRLWVGTFGGGVDLFENGKKIKSYTQENNRLHDNYLLSGIIDSNGDIWLGTSSHGVVRYNKNKDQFEKVITPAGDNFNDVQCLFEDKHKALWIGTSDGIIKYDLQTGSATELVGEKYGYNNNLIRSISQDAEENYWIGTLIDGLIILTPELKVKQNFKVSKGFISNGINHVYRDSSNNMWVASRYGVARFISPDYSQYHVYNKKDGLKDYFIRAIVEGVNGEIWMSTNEGISRYCKQTNTFENYNYLEGVPAGSFSSGSVAKSTEGLIYFGSHRGLCYFDSKEKPRNFVITPIEITEFNIYSRKNIQTGETINKPIKPEYVLNHDENTFTIGFNVMDYSLKDKVEYSYSLTGLDETWYSTEEQKHVTFRNIPPGKYSFYVKGRIRGQEWIKSTAVHIEILPPFWLSWWAKVLYVFIAALIIISIVRFYKRKLKLESLLYLEKENSKKEQELHDEKLKFYTHITHELRTPLTLIMGPLEDMLISTKIPYEENAKLSLIHRSAVRLYNLINQILEFRKSETQNRVLSLKYGDISTLITEIGIKYKELNQNRDIEIKIINESINTQLYYDEEVITVVLDNLISNALKYTLKGNIQIMHRNIREENKEYFEIEIRDTGIGISPYDQNKIFDQYYQVSGKSQMSGTGIGLALVKKLVQLHEGEIQVKSKEGKGTSFFFRINMANTYKSVLCNISESSNEIHENSKESKPILLIVEDNIDIRNYIEMSLKDAYKILMAENGEQGIEMSQKVIPDIVISDIMMPVMDGITFCKILKGDIRTSHIPIILLTAKDTLKDKTFGYQAGADSYITKPFSALLLQTRIQNLLDSRKKIVDFVKTRNDKKTIIEDSINELDSGFIAKAISIIKDNMDNKDITITFLSEQMCMSDSTFYRKIKALTGFSGNEFIRKVKMQYAEEMILSQKYTISEISYMVGCNSLTQFRRLFKSEFGVPPSEYIDKINKG